MDEREVIARRYGEHLTDADLLALAGGHRDQVAALRRAPTLILDLLDRPAVADRLARASRDEPERFTYVSPFLIFAAAVHRTSNDLVGSTYVAERTGARDRVPVFDGPALAAFGTEPGNRLYLAELLASYSRVASGVTMRRTERGWRRQRWDELDLPRLAALLDAVPAEQRPAVWRRIGDGAIFLAGIFPEHADRVLGPRELVRLVRATGLPVTPGTATSAAELAGLLAAGPAGPGGRGAAGTGGLGPAGGLAGDTVALLENLARRAYERVGSGVPPGAARSPSSARRLLTLVRDRYLFPLVPGWLPRPDVPPSRA